MRRANFSFPKETGADDFDRFSDEEDNGGRGNSHRAKAAIE
ncbi:MAG: hypothetical protein O3A01_07445 [bacterium]|nr:hypothetical protein [bacterium]